MRLYKVLTAAGRAEAEAKGRVEAPVDKADGYIHLSTTDQLPDTLRKWFAGAGQCVVLEYDSVTFGVALKWEPARGGELFPHVYGEVSLRDALRSWEIGINADGRIDAPADFPRAGSAA